MEIHSFYCINCGNKNLDLPRRASHNYGRFHRKKLWCRYCGCELNSIECKNDVDVYDFKIMFEEGMFKNEAEKSLAACRNPRVG